MVEIKEEDKKVKEQVAEREEAEINGKILWLANIRVIKNKNQIQRLENNIKGGKTI